LLEIILQDGIALSEALAEEEGFFLFFILEFFFVKFRKRVLARNSLLDRTLTVLFPGLNLVFADFPADKLGHSRLGDFTLKLNFFLNQIKNYPVGFNTLKLLHILSQK
jgi:hypothetical protein